MACHQDWWTQPEVVADWLPREVDWEAEGSLQDPYDGVDTRRREGKEAGWGSGRSWAATRFSESLGEHPGALGLGAWASQASPAKGAWPPASLPPPAGEGRRPTVLRGAPLKGSLGTGRNSFQTLHKKAIMWHVGTFLFSVYSCPYCYDLESICSYHY